MDWNDVLTIILAVDTALNPKLLIPAWFGWRWWDRRKRRAQEGQDAVAQAGPEDPQADATKR